VGGMYLYIGLVEIRGVRGYMWLLGRRLYLKLSWRARDTLFLGNLANPLSIAVRLKRLLPKPVDVRAAAYAVARALAMAKYVAEKCRDSPTWKVRTWELKMAVEDAVAYLQWIWPWTTRLFSPRGPP